MDMDTKIRIISKIEDTRTQIYILYNYELYKLTKRFMCTSMLQIIFLSRKMFFKTYSKGFVFYFYNHNKNLYNKFVFLEN